MTKRIFSEKEASELIQRAVEIQETTGDLGKPYQAGVTWEELKRIAEETGLDPKFLEMALERQSSEVESTKGPFHFTEEFETVIEGELDPNDFDVVVENIKTSGKANQPHAAQVGRTLTTFAFTGWGQSRVDVSSRNGRTRLRVKSNAFLAYFLALHGPLIASIIVMANMAEQGNAPMGFAIGGGLLAAGLIAFRWVLKNGHKAARKLLGKLEGKITEEIAMRQRLSGASSETADAEEELGAPLHQQLGDL